MTGATRLDDIVHAVRGYAPNADVDLIVRAYMYAARAHQGQTRKSGEAYFIHPIAVAGILADLQMDVDTIAVGLLHDTLEDCLATRDELQSEFGRDVAEMVDGVTKIGKLEFRTQHEAQAENFRKLVLAMAKDIRVILVKLTDRLHNMRTMGHMKPEKARTISEETLEIYAPIANRLGLSRLKMELEDLCLQYLHPDVHAMLSEKLQSTAAERDAYLGRACGSIRAQLAERGLEAQVRGRPKHLASIYRKMKANDVEFEQLHDLLGVRVFVDDLGQCYSALGFIHMLYRHVPERLKDYIANPKSNGYQSLHTVILGPEGRQIEVQIRTHAMHRVAEDGIAAHWQYKEGHLALSREDVNKITQLRALFEAAREVEDPAEFLETVKVDLFAEEVFAFTPTGDVRFFPLGATVLDFAYAIHTEVGNTCTGARINGRMVPLRTQLREGDTVEIIRKADQKPNREWLSIARTGRALSKIRRAIREDEREQGKELGRELLESELRKRGRDPKRMHKSGEIAEAAKSFGHRSPELLYLAIAQGNVSVRKVLQKLLPAEAVDQEAPANPLVGWLNKLRRRSESPVLINGEADVLVSYAGCCRPLPGEPVAGFITRGHGISVHLATCPQLHALDPERRIPVAWHDGASGLHTGEVRIITSDKPGMLAEVGAICKTLSINVSRMEARALEGERAEFTLAVNVHNIDELHRLIRSLEKVPGVLRVDRVREVA